MENDVIVNVPLNDFGTTDFQTITEIPLEEKKIEEKEPEKVEEVETEKPKEEVSEITLDLNEESNSSNVIEIDLMSKAEELLGSDYLDSVVVNDIPAREYITDIETLLDLVKEKHQDEINGLKESSVSLANLDQIQKDIVNIVAKGGNPTELLLLQQNYLQPLSDIDIETEEGQIEAIRIYLEDKGNSDDMIDILIEGFKAKGILEDKGIEAKESLDKKYKAKIEEVARQEQERLETLQKQHKQYIKDITAELKSMGYNDKAVKEFKEFATEIKSRGDNSTARMTDMDAMYLELRNNPKTAIDLILYLKNPEEFKKAVSKKETTKTHIESAKKIVISKVGKSSSSKTPYERKLERNDGVIAEIPL